MRVPFKTDITIANSYLRAAEMEETDVVANFLDIVADEMGNYVDEQDQVRAIISHINERLKIGKPIPPIDLVFHLAYKRFLDDSAFYELLKRDGEYKRATLDRDMRKKDMVNRIKDQHCFFNQAAAEILASRYYLD